MLGFTSSNWFWEVAETPGQIYSSAAAGYVALDNPALLSWLATGNAATRIPTEAELRAVLERAYPAGAAGLAAPSASPIRRILPLAFRRRLSAETRDALTVAVDQALRADPPDPVPRRALDDLAAGHFVDLDDPDTIAAVGDWLARGWITTEQHAALLADGTPDEAWPPK